MFKRIIFFSFVSIVFALNSIPCYSAQLKDTESASHADTAAMHDIVDTYQKSGFKVIQFNLAVLSHYSYMLISGNEAIVVDPGRDVFKYIDVAKQENVTIKGILLTHSHADFVAGHNELANRTNAPIYISEKANAGYSHTPTRDGSIILIGDVTIKVLETPGHTLDCTTSLVYSSDDKNTPKIMFSGDTLFVGSIGRPDLMGGTISAAELASMSFDTWTKKLSALDDSVVVFPAHGAGSLCGAHLSDDPYSTIGRERKTNTYLQFKSRSEFISAVLEGLPDAPQYFKHNAAMNKNGPKLINWEEPLDEMNPDMLLTDSNYYYVIDIRSAKEFALGHIPNSVNIGLRGRLETWTGIMVPWNSKLVLTGKEEELKEAVYRLHRVGYKAKVIKFDTWKTSGMAMNKNNMIEPKVLYSLMQRGEAPIILDVRLPSEWMGLRIGKVINLPLNQLENLSSKLDPTQPVVAVCNSAYRSSMAVGVLERKGFTKASSLNGGSEAWINAGFPVFGAQVEQSPKTIVALTPKREINLPGRIASSELKSMIMDLPGTFDLVDIRPVEQFADYHLPGSVNVDIVDLMSNPAYLVGTGPLIIIDRDGSLSMIIAGMLFQKTQRQIKALRGGLETYWSESEIKDLMNSKIPTTPMTSGSSQKMQVPVSQPSMPVMQTQPETQIPQKPKKKSAGC
ncbi:MAG: MBL fold metallo-hydrolase [Candidatus Omnitrophica bacterium]|nr:MBL fold metallo-hydrolase [Candidatus Omnitrophota bacterium]MBU1997811.1 MBL fold metallo-hydrolase [Candidatus Omnitrophota bacterium]